MRWIAGERITSSSSTDITSVETFAIGAQQLFIRAVYAVMIFLPNDRSRNQHGCPFEAMRNWWNSFLERFEFECKGIFLKNYTDLWSLSFSALHGTKTWPYEYKVTIDSVYAVAVSTSTLIFDLSHPPPLQAPSPPSPPSCPHKFTNSNCKFPLCFNNCSSLAWAHWIQFSRGFSWNHK